ncbi:precorrin-2 dehydrogenase/sirohydrochlorin ferrochelatase family protein [Falsiroseomonas sp. HC035]|uniref:precorrin-2 dehydrogenase/sirohydrochlorin ferrochelatase family protein n=1 Tax=Falsiroseomonas sp. HC035 TaxID=3390999 RepID=UPI003D320409
MLPLVFATETPTLLAGTGPCFDKRLRMLRGAGLSRFTVFENRLPPEVALEGQALVFGAGFDDAESDWLAGQARRRGIPVNIEDVPRLCDFHVPAMVRRGRLLVTVSTNGAAPALSSALRMWLEEAFGPEWAGRLEEVALMRAALRAEGRDMGEVRRAVHAHLAAANWLGQHHPPSRREVAWDG